MNYFTSTGDETKLHYRIAMTRHLARTCNLRIAYPDTDILLFDDDDAGSFRHAKHHPDIAAAHSHSVS